MEYEEAKKKEKPYIEKFLTSKNFKKAGTCHCGGVLNHRYSYRNFVVYVRYKQGFFKIKHGNTTLVDLTKIDELEKYFQAQESVQKASN